MNKNQLVGTWNFVSCVAQTSTGETHYPWGHDAKGFLSYTPEGYVFVTSMNATTFESYCGTYAIEDNSVTHNIDLCSNRAFNGTSQKRFFSLNGDELSLTTAPINVDGVTHSANLMWRRVSSEG